MTDCKICGGEHRPGQPVYLLDCYQRGYARLLTEVAAAEERGRRSGVEDLADLLLECEEALIWCSAADAFSPDGIAAKGWQRIVLPVLERVRITRKSLAPRDSGKGPDPLGVAELFDPAGDEE